MKAQKHFNHDINEEESDELKSVTRLIAMNAILEASRMGRAGEKFAELTQQMIELARDASSDDADMAAVIEQQVKAINELSSVS